MGQRDMWDDTELVESGDNSGSWRPLNGALPFSGGKQNVYAIQSVCGVQKLYIFYIDFIILFQRVLNRYIRTLVFCIFDF